MNNDFYKNAYTQLAEHAKMLLSKCHKDEYLSVWVIESGKNIPVQCISYVGYGWVALSTKRNEEVLVPLQSLQVHFEFVDISKRTPEYSFQIEEIDPRIQW